MCVLQTNIYKYLVWRRRSLYAVLFPCLVLFAEVSTIVDMANLACDINFGRGVRRQYL
jgi:hypothetical protein